MIEIASVAAQVVVAWGRILAGYNPILSIEITRECPLNCPGCYAYNGEHLGGEITLRQVSDLKGKALVEGVLELLKQHKPQRVSLIGGEPLVRVRELDELLPKMSAAGVHTQLVTSAVRPVPLSWNAIRNLQICVSVDGLAPEHDVRRKPATYDRILKNIAGHRITVHCTVTRQLLSRESYLEEFVQFWSEQDPTERIWMSLYTPQINEVSAERLTLEDREFVVDCLLYLRNRYPKLDMPPRLLDVYKNPPSHPGECIFASVTTCLSADLKRKITPCQFGGVPDCKNCGCMASAGLAAIGRHPLKFGIRPGPIYWQSKRIGNLVKTARDRFLTAGEESSSESAASSPSV